MRNQPDCPLRPTPATAVNRRQYYGPALLLGLFALLSSCNTNRIGSTKGERLRLNVGDIRELALSTRSDTTWQLTATSDNQEVVDVSRKPAIATVGSGTNPTSAGPAVFLVKGVTAGTANVVFSEKQMGTDGNGRVKKTYVVTVVNK